MANRVVKRISFFEDEIKHIKRLRIKPFNSFVRMAVIEKLERDFKVKPKIPF